MDDLTKISFDDFRDCETLEELFQRGKMLALNHELEPFSSGDWTGEVVIRGCCACGDHDVRVAEVSERPDFYSVFYMDRVGYSLWVADFYWREDADSFEKALLRLSKPMSFLYCRKVVSALFDKHFDGSPDPLVFDELARSCDHKNLFSSVSDYAEKNQLSRRDDQGVRLTSKDQAMVELELAKKVRDLRDVSLGL